MESKGGTYDEMAIDCRSRWSRMGGRDWCRNIKRWTLESGAPGLQAREGMTAKSLKPGDEVVVRISPLHSGAEGGSFQLPQIKFKDGRPVVAPR